MDNLPFYFSLLGGLRGEFDEVRDWFYYATWRRANNSRCYSVAGALGNVADNN
jgi:hypothetical protein